MAICRSRANIYNMWKASTRTKKAVRERGCVGPRVPPHDSKDEKEETGFVMKRRCNLHGYRPRLYIINVFKLYAQGGVSKIHDGIPEQVPHCAPLHLLVCLIILTI